MSVGGRVVGISDRAIASNAAMPPAAGVTTMVTLTGACRSGEIPLATTRTI